MRKDDGKGQRQQRPPELRGGRYKSKTKSKETASTRAKARVMEDWIARQDFTKRFPALGHYFTSKEMPLRFAACVEISALGL